MTSECHYPDGFHGDSPTKGTMVVRSKIGARGRVGADGGGCVHANFWDAKAEAWS